MGGVAGGGVRRGRTNLSIYIPSALDFRNEIAVGRYDYYMCVCPSAFEVKGPLTIMICTARQSCLNRRANRPYRYVDLFL